MRLALDARRSPPRTPRPCGRGGGASSTGARPSSVPRRPSRRGPRVRRRPGCEWPSRRRLGRRRARRSRSRRRRRRGLPGTRWPPRGVRTPSPRSGAIPNDSGGSVVSRSRSAARSTPGSSACGTGPRKWARAPTPAASAAARKSPLSSPPPATARWTFSSPSSARAAIARSRRLKWCARSRVATNAITTAPSGIPRDARRPASSRPGANRLVSTPLGISISFPGLVSPARRRYGTDSAWSADSTHTRSAARIRSGARVCS